MKKKIYSIYFITFGIIALVNVVLIPLSIIYNIKIGTIGSLALTIFYLLAFNFSSIVLSKTKLKYHGKTVTKEIQDDIIVKIFWKRALLFGMMVSAIVALIYVVLYYVL